MKNIKEISEFYFNLLIMTLLRLKHSTEWMALNKEMAWCIFWKKKTCNFAWKTKFYKECLCRIMLHLKACKRNLNLVKKKLRILNWDT